MVWLLLLLGCGATIDLETKFEEGQSLVVTDRVQNTVRTIDKGVILEGLRLKTRRDFTGTGVLGEADVGWVETVEQVRVERVLGGKELVWDSSLGSKPPEELGGALDLKSRVRDVQIAATGEVRIKEALSADLQEGGDASKIQTWDDRAYLDIVDLGLLSAPSGEIRVGQTWISEMMSTNTFNHEDHASRIDVIWRVDRIDGTVIQLTQTMSLKGRTTPTEFGWVVGSARGRGTLVFDSEAGVPTEYNEQITYTMASADSEVDQMVTRNRFYAID